MHIRFHCMIFYFVVTIFIKIKTAFYFKKCRLYSIGG